MTKDEIIDRACTMFVNEGVKAVRMDDIARELSISKRTLYEWFGDKEELLFIAVSRYHKLREAENNAVALAAPNIIIALLDVMNAIIDNSSEIWRLHNAMRRFYPKCYKRLIEEDKSERNNAFKQALELGVKQGLLLDNMNFDLSIALLKYMAEGVINNVEELDLPPNITSQVAFRELFVSFMRGISTTQGIKLVDEYIENMKTR